MGRGIQQGAARPLWQGGVYYTHTLRKPRSYRACNYVIQELSVLHVATRKAYGFTGWIILNRPCWPNQLRRRRLRYVISRSSVRRNAGEFDEGLFGRATAI